MADFLVLNQDPELKSKFTASDKAELVFTHPIDWHGGATGFFNDFCEQKLKEGTSLIIVSFAVMSDYKPVWRFDERLVSGETQCFGARHLIGILDVYYPVIRRIVVNNFNGLNFFSPGGFFQLDKYRELTGMILQLRKALNCELVYFFHDFFTACPYLFLVSDQMTYCRGGSGDRQCRDCLKGKHPWTFEAEPGLDINAWRECSWTFLRECTKLVFFSLSTLNLVEHMLPGIVVGQPEKITLMGQRKEDGGFTPVDPTRRDKPVIGVLGTIQIPKGIKQVLLLNQYIREQHKDAEIVVIGELKIKKTAVPNGLKVTGKYKHEELHDIIKKHGVNVIFFSSIWPETYSRVVAEIQELDLPVALYPLGAPSERMRLYGKALPIPDFSVESTYDMLEKLFLRFVKKP